MTGTSRVLLFVKAPEKGKVKSRLASAVGEDAAFEIYKCLAADLLETLKTAGLAFVIYFFPPEAQARIMKWLGPGHTYRPQQGADLGERMKNAFIRSFSEGADRAVLIGSDVPDVTPPVLHEALASLDTHDAVIGPALDGGYYLIGFAAKSLLPSVFDGIAWGTHRVFEQTADSLMRGGRRVHRLRPLQDIDTPDDLRTFAERRLSGTPGAGNTVRYLLRHKELFP